MLGHKAERIFLRRLCRGVWKKNGVVFDMYRFDAVSDGLLNVATGKMDLVNRMMKFRVAPLK